MALPRLYAILDTELTAARGLDPLRVLDAWLKAGVGLVQLRAKTWSGRAFLELADQLVARARAANAAVIINDRADIALMAGAAGVHVGQDDLRPSDVRRLIGPDGTVGLSTHKDSQVRDALIEPISYLAVGPVFATQSKARPDPVIGLEGVRRAAALAHPHRVPVVAIGGITIETAPSVVAAGASTVAVISDLLRDAPGERARAFLIALGDP